DDHLDTSMRTPASTAKLLAGMREVDPAAALEELTSWLEKGLPGPGHAPSAILSQIDESASAHVGALLARFLGKPSGNGSKADQAGWETLSRYLLLLARALYTPAGTPLKDPDSSQSLRLVAAADAARCIHACRTLAKAWLIRYLMVSAKLWRVADAVHDKAQKVGCAATPVHLQGPNKSATTVTQELLRLLMLHSCAPEMMAPRQIEVADRVIEQLGQDFTLRPRGMADMPFCFDPSSDLPPHRSNGESPGAD